ncbi:MAG TPA: hypothetical protein VF801_06080 [Rhodocyclaceae bacterium]
MKIKLSIPEILAIALIGLAAYGLAEWGTEAMRLLQAWMPRQLLGAPPAPAAPALTPLPRQIALCRKAGPGYQACMFNAGYSVNADWTKAHDDDKQGAQGTLQAGRASELVADPYRAGPSPVYGVPYWVPRPPK